PAGTRQDRRCVPETVQGVADRPHRTGAAARAFYADFRAERVGGRHRRPGQRLLSAHLIQWSIGIVAGITQHSSWLTRGSRALSFNLPLTSNIIEQCGEPI